MEGPPVTELYARSWALDDIEILRGADGHGDGRTVRAYAAVFDTPAEIKDQHGHYVEQIDRRAFNRQIGLGIDRVNVFYNHTLTAMGTPSELGSVPIGSPVEIRPDGKGLLTVTRYNRSQLADSVLEAIRAGDIRGYSFRGRIFKSNPERMPRAARSGALPTIVRTELGLSEYGPTPSPAYAEAGILAIRAALLAGGLTAEQIQRMFAAATPVEDQDAAPATSTPEPGDANDQPSTDNGHSRRNQQLIRLRAGMRDRGIY
jgi:HK97 family phage prohead protease